MLLPHAILGEVIQYELQIITEEIHIKVNGDNHPLQKKDVHVGAFEGSQKISHAEPAEAVRLGVGSSCSARIDVWQLDVFWTKSTFIQTNTICLDKLAG